MLKFVIAVFFGSLCAAHAQQVLVCEMNTDLGNSAISNRFVFSIEPGAPTAIVNDVLISGTTGGPMVAEVTNDTEDRITIKWRIDESNNTAYRKLPTLLFRATITKADYRINIMAQPSAYDNRFNSKGSCTPQ